MPRQVQFTESQLKARRFPQQIEGQPVLPVTRHTNTFTVRRVYKRLQPGLIRLSLAQRLRPVQCKALKIGRYRYPGGALSRRAQLGRVIQATRHPECRALRQPELMQK